jgi:hypothetical protein
MPMIDQITSFISGINISQDDKLTFRGHVVGTIPASSASYESIRAYFAEFTYKYLYTHPKGDPGRAFQTAVDDPDLITGFAAVCPIPKTLEPDWRIRSLQTDGSVIAERFGLVRKFVPGQFVAETGAIPIRIDNQIKVSHLVRSGNLQSGFYHFFGKELTDMAEHAPVVRLYFNVNYTHAIDFIESLLERLNFYKISFTLKIATRAEDYSRCDTAILYIPARMFQLVATVMSLWMVQNKQFLLADVPFFTKPLARGVGLAEDPGAQGSFGSDRCELVAGAILAARESSEISISVFMTEFKQAIAEKGLQLERLYLNPGSDDVYMLPGPFEQHHQVRDFL